MINSGDSGKLL